MKSKLQFDYSKILGIMKEKDWTQSKLAEKIGISFGSLNAKLQGSKYFTAPEIYSISNILECDYQYFFNIEVKK